MLTILAATVPDSSLSVVLEPGYRLELPAQISGRLGRLIVSVQEFQEAPVSSRYRRIRRLDADELDRACSIVQAKYTEGVRLAEVAAAVGLSPWQFSRSFRMSTGMTLTAYVLRTRLDAAMHLMLHTERSLCDIALNCGFGDQSNFSRMFVRAHRITPSRWRKYQETLQTR